MRKDCEVPVCLWEGGGNPGGEKGIEGRGQSTKDTLGPILFATLPRAKAKYKNWKMPQTRPEVKPHA
jgi:hypothetical protein